MTESEPPAPRMGGDPEQAFATLAGELGHAGWRTEPTGADAPWSFVARTSQFRLRWMATQLHTFVFGLPVPSGADVAWLDEQLGDAVQFARRAGGGLPAGLQSGRAVVLAAVGSQLDPELHVWAAKPHARKFAVTTYPVLADLATGHLVKPKRPVIGAIYHGYLESVADTFVAQAVRAG